MQFQQDVVALNDQVIILGADVTKNVTVTRNGTSKLGRAGQVNVGTLVGLPYGCVVGLDSQTKTFFATDENPDLDRSNLAADTSTEEKKDNRNLVDTHMELPKPLRLTKLGN